MVANTPDAEHQVAAVLSMFLAILTPRVVTADVFQFLGSEVVRDIKLRTDLFRSLSLDHVGDGLACKIEKRLNV